MKTVLLTGITGFLGSHTAIQLLNKGYRVIGTLRDIFREKTIRKIIGDHTEHHRNLEIVQADLLDHTVWKNLCLGVDFVQHIASPFPREIPKTEEEVITPAVQGTLAILEAAKKAGVRRVVLTSSTGAILYGGSDKTRKTIYTEEDWTDSEAKQDINAYYKSKTLAEKAAWNFVQKNPSLELSVVCPGAILGPVLESDFGTSANLVIKVMDGSSPALPKIGFELVDVRSIGELLILAMENPIAAGERFIGTAGFANFKTIADTLRPHYPTLKIPSRELPDFMVRIVSIFEPTLKPTLLELGVERRTSSAKAKKLLGWKPKGIDEAILSCAESVVKNGLIKV